jgi:Flp pilus assembly protein TadG
MKPRTPLHPWTQEGGQTLVEFALTLMLLLTLVFGLIEFSRAIYAASVVQWAAQQGARVGVAEYADTPSSELEGLVVDAVRSRMTGLNVEMAAINVELPAPEIIQVDVTYPFEFVVTLFGEGITLQASASMVAH